MNYVKDQRSSKSTSLLFSQSGQGVLEYILVLVVTVSIIIGVMWRFSETFRAWGNNYFGEYLACLLETGELPTIGGASVGGICNEFFEPFTFTAGRPPVDDGSTGGGSGQGQNSGKKDSVSSTRGSRGGGGASSRIGGSSSSSNRFRVGSNGSRGGAGGGKVNRKKDSTYTGSTESSMPGGIYSNQGDQNRIRVRNFEPIGGFQMERPETQRTETRISVKAKGPALKLEQKRMLVKRSIAKAQVDDDDEGMSFGDFFRILIISAIIIALIVFIGGQALQVGKSMD